MPSLSLKPYTVSLRRSLKALPLALGILSLTFITPMTPASSQERMIRTVTVTGRGTESIPATLAQVRLGVEAQGKTAGEVQQEVARRSSAVVALLRSRNVEKLETTGVSLSPLYNYDNGQQRLVGYQASNIVSFRTTTQTAGPLLDEAVRAGASRIDGVSFTAPEAALSQAQQQALREATQDAQQQAQAVLSVLNLSQREVVSIQINGATPPQPPMPPMPMTMRSDKLEAANTPIVGGEQQVEASVTLQISY